MRAPAAALRALCTLLLSVNAADAAPDRYAEPANGVRTSTACDDGHACTVDLVSPSGNCVHVPVQAGTPCDDGDVCNGPDACRGGTCVPNPSFSDRGGFTIAVLPDTQCYTSDGADYSVACGNGAGRLEMLTSQIDWIVRNAGPLRIASVVGLGDIVQCAPGDREWANALTAYAPLDDSNVPYAPVLGNHDYDTCDFTGSRSTGRYNAAFGPLLFGHDWLGSSTFPPGTIDNFYVRTEIAGRHLLVVGLEFLPRPAAVEWATDVLDAHPDDLVIVATHEFLNEQAQRARYTTRDASSPDQVWTALIRDRANVVAVVSGHWPGPSRRTDTGSNGNLIPQMLSNYQWYPHGGSGYLRLLVIEPEGRSIHVQSCSPFLNARLRDDGNEFTVRYGP